MTTVEIIIIIMMIHHQQQQQANWPGQMSMEFMFYPPKNKKKQNWIECVTMANRHIQCSWFFLLCFVFFWHRNQNMTLVWIWNGAYFQFNKFYSYISILPKYLPWINFILWVFFSSFFSPPSFSDCLLGWLAGWLVGKLSTTMHEWNEWIKCLAGFKWMRDDDMKKK